MPLMARAIPTDYPFRCAHCGTAQTVRVLSASPRKARVLSCPSCGGARRFLPPGEASTTLTHREQVVLDLVGQGLTASAIATMIGVGRVRVYQLQQRALAKQAAATATRQAAPRRRRAA